MASRKRFQNDRVLYWKEWNWDCFLTSLLYWTLLPFCISESFWGMAQELARSAAGNFCLFFVVFCPIAGSQRSIMKFKIIGTASFLSTSWRSMKEGPNKLVTKRFCSKLSSVKCFTQTRECFEGMKHSLFTFVSHSFLRFGSWENLTVLTFDFQWFSSEGHYKSETKAVSNVLHFLSSPTVTSQVLFSENYRTIFPTTLRLWRIKTLILTFQYLRNASSSSIETSEYFKLHEHIEL